MTDEDEKGEEGEDPFERLDDVDDREGDPFAHIDSGSPADDDRGADDDSWDASDEGQAPQTDDAVDWLADPLAESGAERESDDGPTGTEEIAEVDSEELFARPDDREGSPFEDAESVFERMDVQGVDDDAVWADLEGLEERGSAAERQRRTYAEVSKHSFCEQCEHFSEPPAVRCTHEGTEILEFPDMETVRVVDCPVVAERRRLEDQE
ncbi:MAG: hypothetical protein ACI8XM_000397 [Haloarculaceae archaeon]|jgi:hypothetical protein